MGKSIHAHQSVVIEPPKPAKKTVFWMHGLGADGHDFVPVVEQIGFGINHDIRFVFPHAPVIPVTINGGMTMRAWYDVTTIDTIQRDVDFSGIESSCELVYQLVLAQYEQGIDTEHMVIAGFSQGGVIASRLASFIEQKTGEQIAGIMCLSTYFPFQDYQAIAVKKPAFVGHGNYDPVIPFHLGEHCRDCLLQAGYDVTFVSYPMEHSVCPEEIEDIRVWLDATLGTS